MLNKSIVVINVLANLNNYFFKVNFAIVLILEKECSFFE